MLLRFGVANHLSIRDHQELSLSASSLGDSDDGLIECAAAPRGMALPAAVVYGANASGKTNLVAAMETMCSMVLLSHSKGEPGGGVPRQPFRLGAASARVPSRFDIDFVLDGVRHHYGFEATDEAFVSEWLYAFPKSHRRTLFERDGEDFRFGRLLKGQNAVVARLTRPNSLYLSAAAQNRHEHLSSIFGYFRSIHGFRNVAARERWRPRGLQRTVWILERSNFFEKWALASSTSVGQNRKFPKKNRCFSGKSSQSFEDLRMRLWKQSCLRATSSLLSNSLTEGKTAPRCTSNWTGKAPAQDDC